MFFRNVDNMNFENPVVQVNIESGKHSSLQNGHFYTHKNQYQPRAKSFSKKTRKIRRNSTANISSETFDSFGRAKVSRCFMWPHSASDTSIFDTRKLNPRTSNQRDGRHRDRARGGKQWGETVLP